MSQRLRLLLRPGSKARVILVVLLLVTLFEASSLAQPAPPPSPRTFFTDTTGTVPGDMAARIEQRLRQFETETSNQILVVVEDRLPQGYTSLEEYTNRTAEAWRVGEKSRDNGAVLFVFVGDRKVRIEVGYGLEGALPDALASRIINDEITPQFRQNRYGEGLLAGVEAIIKATRGEYQPISSEGDSTELFRVLLFIGIFLFIGVILPIWREIQSMQGTRTYSGRGASKRRGWGSSGGWTSGGSSWGGGGGSWGGGGGGGGFSGGGGSFGGGGASGSW